MLKEYRPNLRRCSQISRATPAEKPFSIEEVVESVLATTGDWGTEELRVHNRGKRQGFFCDDPDVNSFLDEALTWRDVGFQWHCAAL